MSSFESFILWAGIAIAFLGIFVPAVKIIIAIIRIFVPNFLRTTEDAPQPAASSASKQPTVTHCPFCGETCTKQYYLKAEELLACPRCKRSCAPNGLPISEAGRQQLALEEEECKRIAAGEYNNVIDIAIKHFLTYRPNAKKFYFNFEYNEIQFSHDSSDVNYRPLEKNYNQTWSLYPTLRTFASGPQALAYQSRKLLQQELSKKGLLYTITDHECGFSIEARH